MAPHVHIFFLFTALWCSSVITGIHMTMFTDNASWYATCVTHHIGVIFKLFWQSHICRNHPQRKTAKWENFLRIITHLILISCTGRVKQSGGGGGQIAAFYTLPSLQSSREKSMVSVYILPDLRSFRGVHIGRAKISSSSTANTYSI